MALIPSVPKGFTTQRFGPSSLIVEPSMWYRDNRAYWLQFSRSYFHPNFHPGIDRAAPTGTAVVAMQSGTVLFAGWKDNISGNQVEVEIRPGTTFSVNHLSKVKVLKGQKVTRGQTIGLVGSTGASTGPHVHEGLTIKDPLGRSFLYNAELYMRGGPRANSPKIRPL